MSLVRQSFVLRSENLGQRLLSGAGFQFLGIALRMVLTIGSTAVLARLLVPADFGYVAMATVFTEFAALFSNFGFTNVLIQRRAVSRVQYDTVFWGSLALGVILALCVFILSFFAGWMFSDQKIEPILRVLSLTFVLGALTSVPWVVLSRLMRFRTEFWLQITSHVIRASFAVGFAWIGYGAWSLVIGALAGAASSAILGFWMVAFIPRLRFHAKYLLGSWRTSGGYFAGGILYYINSNLDLVVIGRGLGAASLGYYQNARSLTDEIRGRIAMPLQHVLFPALSAIQSDPVRIQHLVMKSGRILAAIVIPIGVGVSATAPDLVLVLYGPQWIPMIPVMTMFGVSAAIRAATAIATPLFNASDKVVLALKYNAVGTAVTIGGVMAAVPYGIEGVSYAIALGSLYTLIGFRVAIGLVGMRLPHMWSMLGPPFVASTVMWAGVEVVRQFISMSTAISAPVALLVAHTLTGAVIYVVVLNLISSVYLRDLRELLLKFRRSD